MKKNKSIDELIITSNDTEVFGNEVPLEYEQQEMFEMQPPVQQVQQPRIVQHDPAELETHLIQAKEGNQEAILFLINYYCDMSDHYNALIFFKLYQKHDKILLDRYYLSFSLIQVTKTTFNYLVDLTIKGHEPSLLYMDSIIVNDDFSFLSLSERKSLFIKLNENKVIYFNELLGDIYFDERKYKEALKLYEGLLEINALTNVQNLADIYFYSIEKRDYPKAMKYYLQANNIYTITKVAEMYEKGLGVLKDLDQAYAFYVDCINCGSVEAKYKIISILLDEKCRYYNPQMAFAFADEAALQNLDACFYLGFCHLHGLGTEVNFRLAFNNFFKAAATDDPKHIRFLADCYYSGIGCIQDIGHAVDLYVKVPQSPEINAKLLDCYLIKDDQPKIFRLLSNIVEEDDSNSEHLYKLAQFYLEAEHVQRDPELAYSYLKKAANRGHVESLYLLATEYYQSGVTIKKEESIEWYENLANNHSHQKAIEFLYHYYKDDNAQKAYRYGRLIENTTDTELLTFLATNSLTSKEANLQDAFKYNKYLADNGDQSLYTFIGDFYYHGIAVDKDDQEAFSYYMLSSNNKEAQALFTLGYCYENGIFVDKDYSTAYKYYSDAELKDNHYSKYALATFYEYGINVDINFNKALDIYFELSKSDSYATFKLGVFYEKGLGCNKNINKAISYYNTAYEQGELFAALFLANLYEEGNLVKKDYTKAFNYYKKIFSFNSDAQFKLGQFYQNGYSVKKDIYEAIRYYEMASRNKNKYAEKILGDLYFSGELLEKDYTKAAKYYENAVTYGNKEAYYDLANCYYYGNGVTKSYEKAFLLFNQSAKNNNILGQFGLASCYYFGHGVEQDYAEAFRLYSDVENKGYADASAKLGLCFENGYGVNQNYDKAIGYFKKSMKNSSESKFKLGRYYLEGIYINKDVSQGVKLLEEASNEGNVDAMLRLAEHYKATNNSNNMIKSFNLFKKAHELECKEATREYAFALYFGNGTAKNEAEAAKIFDSNQFKDDVEATYYLGTYLKENSNSLKDTDKAITCLEYAANNNCDKAINDLANIYYEGTFVPKDHKKSFLYYKVLEKNNDRNTLFKLAEFYLHGVSCVKDTTKAIELYEKLTLMNDEESINALGEIYYNFKQYERAVPLFLRVANSNNDANFNIAVCYLNGFGVDVDTKTALKKIEALAKINYPKALNLLGEIYVEGNLYKQNVSKGMKYFELADELGNEKALINLAECHLNGVGVKADKKEAFNIYLKGSAKSNAIAINRLGELYEEGLVVNQDLEKAFNYYTKAVELFNKAAVCNLGKMYYKGLYTEKNIEKAITYFKEADENGFIEASSLLGNCYYFGEGVFRDVYKAYELFSKSIELTFSKNRVAECLEFGFGVAMDKMAAFEIYKEVAPSNIESQYNLARCYEMGVTSRDGQTVSKDLNLAKQYYNKASVAGHVKAKEALNRINNN